MRVLVCGLATTNTDPPRPPSPPLGPPRGTNFSRRNARHPAPPCPASTWMSTSSTNIGSFGDPVIQRSPNHPITRLTDLLSGNDGDDAAHRAMILEFHASGDLGKNRVVLAETGVEPGTEPAAALAHDDRAARDEVAVVRFSAQPLGV